MADDNENQFLTPEQVAELTAAIKPDPAVAIGEPEKTPEQIAAETAAAAEPEKKPLYVQQRRDPSTGQFIKKEFWNVEELARGKEEADNTLWRTQDAVRHEKERNELLQQRITLLEQQMTAVKPKEEPRQTQTGILPQELLQELDPNTVRALELVVKPLLQKIEKLESQPPVKEVVGQLFTEEQQHNQQDQWFKSLDDFAAKHPDLYSDVNTFKIASQYPDHPDYVRAMNLLQVAQYAGGDPAKFEKAHEFLAYQTQAPQAPDIEKIKEEARKQGIEEGKTRTLKELKERGAKFVAPPEETPRGLPSETDVRKMKPTDRLNYREQLLKGIDLTGL
jgi:hypothetical protein